MNSPVITKSVSPKTSYVLLYDVSWDQLEKLDIELLAQYSRMADQYDAVNEFSQVIREHG